MNIHSIKFYATHKELALRKFLDRYGTYIKSDKLYLKLFYRQQMGCKLNLKHPQTFNEKLQYLKLYNRRREYTMMVDKVAVKKYITDILGSEFVIPTLGVWEDPEDIDFEQLPNQFVLKCNHNSNIGTYICRDKSQMDIHRVKEDLKRGLQQDYYLPYREWPYKNVQHRVLAEQYIVDESQIELKDYKIFNFNGIPRLIQLDYNRFKGHNRIVFTPEWERINVNIGCYTDDGLEFKCPETLDVMLDAAKTLSKGIPFLRTDFYSINSQVYFGELTFYPGAGFEKFSPESFDKELGNWLKLAPPYPPKNNAKNSIIIYKEYDSSTAKFKRY